MRSSSTTWSCAGAKLLRLAVFDESLPPRGVLVEPATRVGDARRRLTPRGLHGGGSFGQPHGVANRGASLDGGGSLEGELQTALEEAIQLSQSAGGLVAGALGHAAVAQPEPVLAVLAPGEDLAPGADDLEPLVPAVVEAGVEVTRDAAGRRLEEPGLGELHGVLSRGPGEGDLGAEAVGAEPLGHLGRAHVDHAVGELRVGRELLRVEALLRRGDHRRWVLGGEDALLGCAIDGIGTGGEKHQPGGEETRRVQHGTRRTLARDFRPGPGLW